MSHENSSNLAPAGPTIEIIGSEGAESIPLFPELVNIDIAELATTPADSFIADAVNAGYSDTEIGAALGMDPSLMQFHAWRLAAMGDIISRGPAEVATLPLLQPGGLADTGPDPRMLHVDWLPVVDDQLRQLIPEQSKHGSTAVTNEQIAAFALAWPYQHPFRVINLTAFAEEHGIKKAAISQRYAKIFQAFADAGIQLPLPGVDPRVDDRLDAQLERMGPANAKDIANLLDAAVTSVERSQGRLRERGIVRSGYDAIGVCKAAVAVLRANLGLDNEEIAHVLEVNATTVAGQLQLLRQARPDLDVFNLNARPTAEQWQALFARVREYVDGPGADWRPVDIATLVAQDMGVQADTGFYQSVWRAVKLLRKPN